MKKFKKIARFIVELILAVSIIAFLFIYLISNTILNEKYILSSLEKADYYNKTYELLESNFQNYIQQSGLDEKILKNIVTKEQIEEDTKKIIIHVYDGINEEISSQAIKEKLEKNINKEIDINSLSAESKKAIDDFIEQICKEYRSTIINSEYEQQINSMYKKIMNIINLGKKVLIVSVGVSAIILILLNLKRVYKIVVNIATSMLTAGVFLVVANIYVNTKIKINYITILNDSVSTVIRNIANDILSKDLKYGIILIILGLISSIIANFIHNIIKYKTLMQDGASKEE